MFDLYRSRTDVQALLNHAEPEPSDPQQKYLDEIEIAMCPVDERVDALADVEVSYAVRVECELDLIVAEQNGWIL
jgi:ferredoxin-like protein FixX